MDYSKLVNALAVVCLVGTVIGVGLFIRGVIHLASEITAGAPLSGRFNQIWSRLGHTFTKIFSHRAFKGSLLIAGAHWLVMVSFALLFFTLIRTYGQLLINPSWNLPWGDWEVWKWLVTAIACLGVVAIVALMAVRWWARRVPALKLHTSRFFGSTNWQGLFVEWVILLVCLCVVVLQGLDYALEQASMHAEAAMGEVTPGAGDSGTGGAGGNTAGSASFTSTGAVTSSLVSGLELAIAIVGSVKILVSATWMGVVGVQTHMGVAWHRFLAPLNLLTGRYSSGQKSLGQLPAPTFRGDPVGDLEEAFDAEDFTLGLGQTADLTWKDRLDFFTCTECGRCQDLCPAWNTGKPLSPKLLTLALREHVSTDAQRKWGKTGAAATVEANPATPGAGTPLADALSEDAIAEGTSSIPPATLHDSMDVFAALRARDTIGEAGIPTEAGPLVGDFLNPDILWDCTMCGACVDQCPVDIEHVDRITNLRRYQVLMESAFPKELARPFKGMEKKGNPYNLAARKRLEWAKNLDFEVPVIFEDAEDAAGFDYLFWVGCAGAYDDKQKKTTAAVAELLHTAGVQFAVLGNAESCTGDPARRAGNEILFQMLARQAIDTLHEAKAQRIVVTCAHCFNTIAREFPELDGKFEVIHHTQLLNRLVREGKLRPVAPPEQERQVITYHDPCFLGRHNRVFQAPRELLGHLPGIEMREMARNRSTATCCGAGGARAWMEETRGVRIAEVRMSEAQATGAVVVATACPFCTQMLGSVSSVAPSSLGGAAGAAQQEQAQEQRQPAPVQVQEPQVKDVAILLLESVRRGQAQEQSHVSSR